MVISYEQTKNIKASVMFDSFAHFFLYFDYIQGAAAHGAAKMTNFQF
ncbi:MAG: hypothetical protein U9Q05_03585 [Thermodesulfobacteriota bacterium]|nr:hypothetical protein [Thermodesulfobacteriota bacterium]